MGILGLERPILSSCGYYYSIFVVVFFILVLMKDILAPGLLHLCEIFIFIHEFYFLELYIDTKGSF